MLNSILTEKMMKKEKWQKPEVVELEALKTQGVGPGIGEGGGGGDFAVDS